MLSIADYYQASDIKEEVWLEVVRPNFVNEISQSVDTRARWRKTSTVTRIIGKVVAALGAILTYTTEYLEDGYWTIIAGSMVTVSVVLQQISDYASSEARKCEIQYRAMLNEIRSYEQKAKVRTGTGTSSKPRSTAVSANEMDFSETEGTTPLASPTLEPRESRNTMYDTIGTTEGSGL